MKKRGSEFHEKVSRERKAEVTFNCWLMRFTGINILLLSEPFKKKIDSDFLNGLQT